MKAPCHFCDNRHDGCHSHCPEYIAYDRENQKRREAKYKEYNALSDLLESPSRLRRERKRHK